MSIVICNFQGNKNQQGCDAKATCQLPNGRSYCRKHAKSCKLCNCDSFRTKYSIYCKYHHPQNPIIQAIEAFMETRGDKGVKLFSDDNIDAVFLTYVKGRLPHQFFGIKHSTLEKSIIGNVEYMMHTNLIREDRKMAVKRTWQESQSTDLCLDCNDI